MISRRSFRGGVVVSFLFVRLGCFALAQSPRISVHRDPNCGCSGAWVDHLRGDGFEVSVSETAQLNRIKARLGMPNALASCHTAEIDGFIIEDHIPAGSVRKLLSVRPNIRGLGRSRHADRLAWHGGRGLAPPTLTMSSHSGPSGQSVFARYEGVRELPAT
jgi:hypothetical protein